MLTIVKYIATLVLVVFLITAFLSLQPFATRDLVVAGRITTESVSYELTFDTDSKHTREVDAELKQYLEENIRFVGEGVARVRSSKIEVTPKNVSVTIDKQDVTTPGAVLSAHLQWDTTSGSDRGEDGTIYLVVTGPPYLAGSVSLRSGNYEDRQGSHVVREIKSYGTTQQLAMARFRFALPFGMSFGILLSNIGWGILLYRAGRIQKRALPTQTSGLPVTFSPKPYAAWNAWLYALGNGAIAASVLPFGEILDGKMSSDTGGFCYLILGVTLPIAVTVVFLKSRGLVTVRVTSDGIAYTRGKENSQWLDSAWSDVRDISERVRNGAFGRKLWIQVEFADGRKHLKIEQSIQEYGALRDLLTNVYTSVKPG